MAALVALLASSFSQTESKEPASLAALRDEYEKAVQREQAPLKEIYQQELAKLKNSYAQAGDLESALAVDAEIKGEPGGKKVFALTRLKENYDKAVARTLGMLKPAYQQQLVSLKTELTKSGDLQAALAVDNAIKSLNAVSPAAPTAQTAASTTTAGKSRSFLAGSPAAVLTSDANAHRLAVVNVVDATWEPLKSGAICYANSNGTWKEVPVELEGVRFSRRPHMIGVTKFKVEKPGLVFLATSTRWKGGGSGGGGPDALDQKGLEKKGWRPMPQFDKLANGDGFWMIFYQECAAGEEHTIRTEKYAAPILLIR